MNLPVESRASPPGRPSAAGQTPSLYPVIFFPKNGARAGSASDCTRCLLQKLLNVHIRVRRDSTLREVAASTAAPSNGRQNLLQ